MKPLSILSYFANNKRKLLPSFICISLGVFIIYLFSIIISGAGSAMKQASVDMLERGTFVSSNSKNSISDYIRNKINRDIVPIQNQNGQIQYNSVMGEMSIDVYRIFPQDMKKVLKIFDLKLIRGKVPNGKKNEILLSLKLAKQYKVNVGDSVKPNSQNGTNLDGTYKVTGIIDGPVITAFTSGRSDIKRSEALKNSIIIKVNIKNSKRISKQLKDLAGKSVNIIDYKSMKKQIDQIAMGLRSLEFIIILVIIVVLCVSMANLNYISFINRKNEFSILTAIGYRKGFLCRKLLKENVMNCMTAYISGILFTMLVVSLLNISLWNPNGQSVALFNINDIGTAIIMPAFVAIISMLTPLKEIRAMEYECLNR
ncbi:ABC transporter permease [Clostridium oryzae]|uniref:FtsX-like permease family protein n=1 Tax=Clostridium oryzae TaxID=1450648 RepID=A0A1V4IQT6_9CLOT|nr:ABC transporter permease [Clostridium oryzae]OPJ62263.1 FtsX-like permease family protein [Clostridium oryzae]